jgi:hypothetical protein
MALGRGKTEHSGPRDSSRKDGHWGFTEEAKRWASRARRRDEREQVRQDADLADATGAGAGERIDSDDTTGADVARS